MSKENAKAVIYCRVSSVAQLKKGDGLASQETRCREYAGHKGYEVVKTFNDNKTGGVADRPAMTDLLGFLKKCKSSEYVVIIDDLNRLSRDIVVHWQLRALLSEAGGKLESPSIEFGDDSDSILIENLLASVSQHNRQKNGEQTKNRMRARTLNGYWVFRAPIGYKYQRTSEHGNILVRDEPLASIIAEALEGFASGRFESQGEVKRFLESQPAFPKDFKDGTIRYERVIRLMNRIHYAGYIELPDWNVSLREARHEGLISLECFQKIHSRIREGAKAPARKDINADFPLRGFVVCCDCGMPLTACWSTSKTGKKHPYYMCHKKGCPSYRKSIRRDRMESEFREILQSLKPTKGLFELARDMFEDAWNFRHAQSKEITAVLKRDLKKLEKQIGHFLDRIVETDNHAIIKTYETKITELEREKLIIAEKLAKSGRPTRTFSEMFELACDFLATPCNLWDSGQLTLRRTVLRLAFSKRISHCRKGGFRTPKTSLPFKMLEDISKQKCTMAEGRELESNLLRFNRHYSLYSGDPNS